MIMFVIMICVGHFMIVGMTVFIVFVCCRTREQYPSEQQSRQNQPGSDEYLISCWYHSVVFIEM